MTKLLAYDDGKSDGGKGGFLYFGGSRVAETQSFADQLPRKAMLCQEVHRIYQTDGR
jgi:hypothetical protein